MENQISPTPKQKVSKAVTFSEALTFMISGSRVRRPENWGESYGYMDSEGRIMLHKDGKELSWCITQSDILAIDWEVMNKTN